MKIDVNGITINYERTGSGPSVILVHGNGEDHHIFDVLAQILSESMTVYALDSRGHGESSSVEEYHYLDMADDVSSFIEILKIDRPTLIGFSDGGIIGLMIASEHPELLSKLVVCGPNLSPNDITPLSALSMKLSYLFKKDPLVKLMLTEPNISDDDLQRITIPVMMTFGERDIISRSSMERMSSKISNSELHIVPKADHASYVLDNRVLYDIIKKFLEN